MSQIVESVQGFISEEIMRGSSGKDLDPNVSLLEEGILDSLGLQQLITFLEQKFGITVDDEDLMPENFETVNSIAELVEKNQ